MFITCLCWLYVFCQGGFMLSNYPSRLEASWVYRELERARNIRPGFRYARWGWCNVSWPCYVSSATFHRITDGSPCQPQLMVLSSSAQCASSQQYGGEVRAGQSQLWQGLAVGG